MGDDSPDRLSPTAAGKEEPFGANEQRLDLRQWLAAAGVVLLVLVLTPRLWERVERFEPGPDYRLPYALSEDYWLYARRLRQAAQGDPVVLLGDSFVWGEYVLPEGTLSHYLNRESGQADRFVNAGVNGIFPLAMEGLIRGYGQALRNRKVIVHCNVLWMTSPRADLSSDREERLNHSRLVPQFLPRIPSYRASASDRIGATLGRHVTFVALVRHLQDVYFGHKGIPEWTLADDGGDPPGYPNTRKSPLAQIALAVPPPPGQDPDRGPGSPRHRPWFETHEQTSAFDWVAPDASLQWGAMRRVIRLLRARGNQVLVVVGPFNEHMIAAESQPGYRRVRAGIEAWLERNQVPYVEPEALPSALYADASHPLTAGYALLARRLLATPAFTRLALEAPRGGG